MAALCHSRLWLFVGLSLTVLFGAADAFCQTTTEKAPDTIEARLLACAPCHGAVGEGTSNAYFPRLAGKPAGYLTNQLVAFRNGRRRYPPMNYLLEYLPEEYLAVMASYFAAQRPTLPAPVAPDVSQQMVKLGEQLIEKGDYNRGIPACTSCHGPNLTGMEPAIPGLLGLRASYISGQLGAWRYGTRTATAPDCMQIIAGHLTEDDVKAVAAVLASRPAPAKPDPVPKGSFGLPFACGSQPQ